jgi:hypothetical protein
MNPDHGADLLLQSLPENNKYFVVQSENWVLPCSWCRAPAILLSPDGKRVSIRSHESGFLLNFCAVVIISSLLVADGSQRQHP